MDARTMLKAARPILWETQDETFPYSFGGTCFLVKCEDDFYIISAGHCIRGDANRLFVERYPGGQYPLPVCYLRHMRPDDAAIPEDIDFGDIAIVTIAKEKLDSFDLERFMAIDLTQPLMGDEEVDFANSKTLIRGYPAELGLYEDKELGRGALFASGIYGGNSHFWGLRTMILDNPKIINSYNGLSGSPVCLATGNDFDMAKLAGIVVWGGNGFLHFIDARILRAFFRIIGNPPNHSIRDNDVIAVTAEDVYQKIQLTRGLLSARM